MGESGQREQGSAETDERAAPARIAIDTLLCGAREVILVHAGQDYRLRITSRGKLILTK